jgi:hypothetical protein
MITFFTCGGRMAFRAANVDTMLTGKVQRAFVYAADADTSNR